ncbi:MAG: SH3 domain-containing protein [Hyphomonadaceae bacterium]
MRILAAAVLAATLVSGGAASAQVGGQKPYTTTSYSVEPFTPTTPIMIQGSGVRLRAEPFAGQTQVLSSGSTGLVLNVVGISRQADWDWYQVVLKSGQRAFIRSDLTSAPLRGGSAPAQVAMPVSTPAATPVAPQPQLAPPLPTLGPPQPIEPPPVQLQTPAQPSAPTSNRGSLDLPKPSDPPGLLSH